MADENAGTLAGQTLGGYQIVSLLGVGGMAQVYRARDTALDREVAVKVLPPALARDPNYVQRFRDEGRRVAALDHPNIVPVYQFGEEGDLLFLVMPLLHESLRDRLQRLGVLDPATAVGITTEIARALDAAHALGIVHRDVKPENVLLDADGRALLTDFGIARPEAGLREAGAARTLASTGLPIGTPEYMAPEQLKADTIDHRVDVYGLGAMLYELVTGTVPYDGATPYEVAAKVLTEPLVLPSIRNPTLWLELDAVIVTALSKYPAMRYVDVRVFVAALHRAILQHNPAERGLVLPQGWDILAPETRPAFPAPAAVDTADPPSPMFEPSTGFTASWREHFRKRPPARRKALIVVAAVTVLAIGVCGGSGLAILSRFSGPGTGAGLLSSFGTGAATDTPAGAEPNGTSTVGSGSVNSGEATTGVGPPTGGTGTTPTSTSTPTALPTGTASPVPQPTPTRAPSSPSPLVVSPSLIVLSKRNQTCSGQQTITNENGIAVTWDWSSASPSIQGLTFNINGSTSGSGMPQGITSSGGTDTVSFTMNCSGGQYNTVIMSDDLGNTYTFHLQL